MTFDKRLLRCCQENFYALIVRAGVRRRYLGEVMHGALDGKRKMPLKVKSHGAPQFGVAHLRKVNHPNG
jgi:hypothetical protein